MTDDAIEILLVEDDPQDVELTLRALERGIQVTPSWAVAASSGHASVLTILRPGSPRAASTTTVG